MVELCPSWSYQNCTGRSAQSKSTTNWLQHCPKNRGGGWQREKVSNIKEQNWRRNKNSINRKVYQFNLRTRMLTNVPCWLQNSWEEMFDVLIPWYRVYELIYKTTQDSRLRAFQLKWLYGNLAIDKMLNIWGIKSSKLCRFFVRIQNQ